MGAKHPGFSLQTTERDGRAHIAVRGELDLATAPELEAAVLARVDDADLVVDLRELVFMDSSGVRVLVLGHTRARDAGRRFAIVVPPEGSAVARILQVSGLDGELDLIADPAEL